MTEAAQANATAPAGAAPAPPCTLVIFGASGDLTKRLLMPALCNLTSEGLLDPGFRILGVDAVEHDDAGFRSHLDEALRTIAVAPGAEGKVAEGAAWPWLAERIHYLSGDFGSPATYEAIGKAIERLSAVSSHKVVFYYATSPRFFGPITEQLHAAGLLDETEDGWRRVIIEKPFGTDLASAKALNARLLRVAEEHQLYRMDHFLGKETVQNIMVLRFANGLFEPLWNREHIEHVQITAAEAVTVEARGKFYDATGALRDMVPNHMFQLLAMMAMEAPNSFDADPIRTEKAKVIEAIRRYSPEEAVANAVRAQYGAGSVQGRKVDAYRSDPNVDPASKTETYVAMKFLIDNWRWSGVPFYVRTGKAMTTRRTEIAIQFKRAPAVLFRGARGELKPNVMVFRIQPNEGVSLRFAAKVPGRRVTLSDVDMDFRYSDYFRSEPSTGYETLIYDCLIGDNTLFQRADNVEAGWAAVQPMLDGWASGLGDVDTYDAGSAGPASADALLERDGFRWLPLE